jgi:hypothetical protein
MSIEVALWIAVGFILLQATFMYWVIQDTSKSFWKMSDQLDRLITILQTELLDADPVTDNQPDGNTP